jgi:amino acid permease
MHQKYIALFTSVNILLGTGPLILPMPFFDAGILLSILWMIFICILSYNSAIFIIESMLKVHKII